MKGEGTEIVGRIRSEGGRGKISIDLRGNS